MIIVNQKRKKNKNKHIFGFFVLAVILIAITIYIITSKKRITIAESFFKDCFATTERIIYKPRFYPDQVVHWALMLQLEDILMKGMYYYNCASIKGRGLLHATKYIEKIIVQDRKNTKYCLKLDIKKFYPSVDKEILKRKFRRKIKERETLDLIDKIIDSSDIGLPIR